MPADYQSVLSHGLIVIEGAGSCDYPAVGDVRDGIAYDSGGMVGTLELPVESDVREGIGYGEDGTEFTGTLEVLEPVVISEADEIHYRIKLAALEIIRDMLLPGDGVFEGIGSRVFSQLFPDETGVKFPCVLLTTEDEMERQMVGDSENERWQYPLRVFIADSESARKHEKEGLYMSWRKLIIRRFHNKALGHASVPEAEGCLVEPDVIFDEKMTRYQRIVSSMRLWVSTTEAR